MRSSSTPSFTFYADTIRREIGREPGYSSTSLSSDEVTALQAKALRDTGRLIRSLKNWKYQVPLHREIDAWALGFGGTRGVRVLRELLLELLAWIGAYLNPTDDRKYLSMLRAILNGLVGHIDDELQAYLMEIEIRYCRAPPPTPAPNQSEHYREVAELRRAVRIAKQLYQIQQAGPPFVVHLVTEDAMTWVGGISSRDAPFSDSRCTRCRDWVCGHREIPLYVRKEMPVLPVGYRPCQ